MDEPNGEENISTIWADEESVGLGNCPYLLWISLALLLNELGECRCVWLRSCNVSASLHPSPLLVELFSTSTRFTCCCCWQIIINKISLSLSLSRLDSKYECTLGRNPCCRQSPWNCTDPDDCGGLSLLLLLCFDAEELPKLKSRLWSGAALLLLLLWPADESVEL